MKVSEIKNNEIVTTDNGQTITTKLDGVFITLSKSSGILSMKTITEAKESVPVSLSNMFSFLSSISPEVLDFNGLVLKEKINISFNGTQ